MTPLPPRTVAYVASEPARTPPGMIRMRVQVRADPTTVYGTPWDGVSGGGPLQFALPTSSPPDLAVCIVAIDGERPAIACEHRGTAHQPVSLCEDSFECTFDVAVPQSRPFGLIIYDIDEIWFGADRHDLVDVAIVAEPADDMRALAEAVRTGVARIARTDISVPGLGKVTVQPGELLRRERPYPVLRRGQCAAAPCRLTQSTVTIAPTR
jgi:hypothetical protein